MVEFFFKEREDVLSTKQISGYGDHVNDKDYPVYGLGYKLLSAEVMKSYTSFPAQNLCYLGILWDFLLDG